MMGLLSASTYIQSIARSIIFLLPFSIHHKKSHMFKFNFIQSSNEYESSSVPTPDQPLMPQVQMSTENSKVNFLNLETLPFPSSLASISDEGNIAYSIDSISDSSLDGSLNCLNHLKRIHICSKSADRFLIHHTHIQSSHVHLEMEEEEEVSDVVPGIYEGGMKVWECSYDLCRYLHDQISICLTKDGIKHSSLRNCRSFVELGCGHGLPTCFLVRAYFHYPYIFSGSKKPCFLLSDFNDFVLREVTWPNLIMNMSSCTTFPVSQSYPSERELLAEVVQLVSGDWHHLSNDLSFTISENGMEKLPPKGRFDCILATETLYTVASTRDTAEFIVKHLKVETGIALVATKRYYFGVGGGTEEFMVALQNQSCVENGRVWHPKVERIQEYTVGTVRDLLQVQLVCELEYV